MDELPGSNDGGPSLEGSTTAERAARSLSREGLVFAAASSLQLVSSTIVLPLVTRQLDPSEYGLLATALLVAQLLAIVSPLGLPAAVTREYLVSEGSNPDTEGTGPTRALGVMVAAVATSASFSVLATVTGPIWVRMFSDVEFDAAMAVAVWSAVPATLLVGVQGILRAEHLAKRYAATAVIGSIGGQVVGLGALLAGGGVTQYLAGNVIATSVAGAVGLLWCGLHRLRRPAASLVRRALRVGAPTIPHMAAVASLGVGDRIVVERVAGLAAVGRYQIAYAAGAIGIRLLQAVNNAWSPLVFEADGPDEGVVLRETTRQIAWMAAVVASGLAIGAPLLLAALAPPEYQPADLASVTSVAALGVLPYTCFLASAQVLYKRGRTTVFAWATPTAAIVNLMAAAVLTERHGLLGAAWASVGAYALLAAITAGWARSRNIPPWGWRALIPPFSLALVVVALALLLPTEGGFLFVRGAIGVALLAVLIIGVVRNRGARAITPERA